MASNQRIGLIVIAILVLARLVIVPWQQWLAEQTEQIAQLKRNEQRFANVQQREAILQSQQDVIRQRFAELEALWYNKSNDGAQVAVMRHIEQLAKKHNVELTTRNPGGLSTDGATVMTMSIFVQGKPQQIFKFVTALETTPPYSLLSTVRIVKANRASDNVAANFDLVVPIKPETIKDV